VTLDKKHTVRTPPLSSSILVAVPPSSMLHSPGDSPILLQSVFLVHGGLSNDLVEIFIRYHKKGSSIKVAMVRLKKMST